MFAADYDPDEPCVCRHEYREHDTSRRAANMEDAPCLNPDCTFEPDGGRCKTFVSLNDASAFAGL